MTLSTPSNLSTASTTLPAIEKELNVGGDDSPVDFQGSDLEKGNVNNTSDDNPTGVLAPIRTHKSTTATNKLSKAVTALDWTGPDDPENPQNWPMRWRVYHTFIPAMYGFTVTFASSVYTLGVPDVSHEFHVGTTVSLLGLSLYTLGLGFGPIIAAPLSETYGRRIVYFLSLPVFGLFILGGGFSHTISGLMITRFLAGLFGSPVLAVGGGTNADLWKPSERGVATSLFLLAPFLGPALGPVVGGFVVQDKGWRWTQWTILFFAIFSYLFSAAQKETYKKIILLQRARRLGIPAAPSNLPASPSARLKFMLTVTLLRPLHMLFTEPIVGFLSLYVGFAFSVLFAFFAAFPLVFQRVYGFDRGEIGLTFLAIGVGCLLAVLTVIIIDRTVYQKLVARSPDGVVAPEHRLYPAMIGSAGLPIALFWFAWTARSDISWASPVVAAIPFAWGNLCIFTSAAVYMVDTYAALNGASALAANGIARYALGAAFPLFTIQMYNKLGIGWATSLLGFLSLALLPVPWVIFKWGPSIRAKSAYDTIKILSEK